MDYRKLFSDVHARPGLWGLRDGSFATCTAFVLGVDAGSDHELLTGFREWLVVRFDGGNNLAWTGLVLRLAFPDFDGGPMPPDGDQQAVDTLFGLLDEFLALRTDRDWLVTIYDNYLAWLKAQSWYRPG